MQSRRCRSRPSRRLQAAGIKPQDALPEEQATEQKVERLKAERERLGGVNLMAETEATEVQEKLDVMVKDRDDLVAAIAKLRVGHPEPQPRGPRSG